MPRPHHPARGGPHLPAWDTNAARKPRRSLLPTPAPASRALSKTLLTAANAAPRPNPSDPKPPAQRPPIVPAPPTNAAPRGQALMWLAAIVCIAALFFTLIVLIQHGG